MKMKKDNKGRILNKGESQRNNLTYQYRQIVSVDMVVSNTFISFERGEING